MNNEEIEIELIQADIDAAIKSDKVEECVMVKCFRRVFNHPYDVGAGFSVVNLFENDGTMRDYYMLDEVGTNAITQYDKDPSSVKPCKFKAIKNQFN